MAHMVKQQKQTIDELIKKIAAYEEWILDFANKQIEKFADQGKCEFIESFARPLPLSVILHVIVFINKYITTIISITCIYTRCCYY